MEIELCCEPCNCRFSAPPDLPRDWVLHRMTEEGPWFALAEGATFEDMIFAALLTRGAIGCPECRELVGVREASMGGLLEETPQAAS
jgi:hypothetical protein